MRRGADRNRGDACLPVFRHVPQVDPPGGLEENLVPETLHRFPDSLGRHVVEKEGVRAGGDGFFRRFQALHLDFHTGEVVRHFPGRRHGHGDPPRRTDGVLLDENAVGQAKTVAVPAACPHGVLFQDTKQGSGLPGVQNPGAERGYPFDIRGRGRGDSGQAPEDTQRHALLAGKTAPEPGGPPWRTTSAATMPPQKTPLPPARKIPRAGPEKEEPKGSPKGASSRSAARTISSYSSRDITAGVGSPVRGSGKDW